MVLKGIGYGDKTAADVAKINSLNPDWWYNWGQKRVVATKDNTPEFVPMLYSDNAERLAAFAADIKALKDESPRTITAILGPNEPDWEQTLPDGTKAPAKMTPLEVLNIWKYIQDNGYALRKGSPAPVSTSRIWMDRFMGAQKALDQGQESWNRDFEVNFVAVHIYQNPSVSTFFNKCKDVYAKYGKPVWVTETCVHDFDANTLAENKYSRTQVNDYMAAIFAGAADYPWLERIAWHTRAAGDPVGGTANLFNADGTLTSTGQLYASL